MERACAQGVGIMTTTMNAAERPPRVQHSSQFSLLRNPMLGELTLPSDMQAQLAQQALAQQAQAHQQEMHALKERNAQQQRSLLVLYEQLKQCARERDGFRREADRRQTIGGAQTIFMHREWTSHPEWTGMDAIVNCQEFVRCFLREADARNAATRDQPQPRPRPRARPRPEPDAGSAKRRCGADGGGSSSSSSGTSDDTLFDVLSFDDEVL